jgi:hypothetical protein
MKPQSVQLISILALVMMLAIACVSGNGRLPSQNTSVSTPTNPPPEGTNTPIPTVVEPGLAYGIPCKAPCWRGLIPGVSTRQDAAEAIEQLRSDGWAHHIVDGSSIGGGYSISPSPFTSHGTIDVIFEGDTVAKISGSTLLFYHPIGSLIEQFGSPEGLYLVSGGGPCSSCQGWALPDSPVQSVPVHLLYPSQGLWFLALVPYTGLGCLCPEMRVVAFCYYSPRSMKEALSDDYLTTVFVALKGVAEEALTEWHGFGGGY